ADRGAGEGGGGGNAAPGVWAAAPGGPDARRVARGGAEAPPRRPEPPAPPPKDRPAPPHHHRPPGDPPGHDAREAVRPGAAPVPDREQEAQDRQAHEPVVAGGGQRGGDEMGQHGPASLSPPRVPRTICRGWSIPARRPLRIVARIFRSPGPALRAAATRASVTTTPVVRPAPTS